MLRKPSCLLALVLVCGVGQAGVSAADGTRFIGQLPQGTVGIGCHYILSHQHAIAVVAAGWFSRNDWTRSLPRT